MKRLLLTGCIALVLMACEKEEHPVAPAPGGSWVAGMGSDYSTGLFFHMGSGEFVDQQLRDGYTLGVLSNGQPYLYLNSANFMYAKRSGQTNFDAQTDTVTGTPWRYDFPTGDPQRTAIGKWWDEDGNSREEVYVLDLGYDAAAQPLGFLKMQVLGSIADFNIRAARLDGSSEVLVEVIPDPTRFRTRLSLLGFPVTPEPDRSSWDLHFTQYTDYDLTTEGDTLSYLVRGVLLNPERASALKITDRAWEDITFSWAQQQTLSSDWNVIGYDWKYYSLNTALYEITPDQYYLLRDVEGTWYKLRFLDFYNEFGERGFASFELVNL